MAGNPPDFEEIQRRFARLRRLFETDRKLSRLRPNEERAAAAMREFLDANPGEPTGEEAESVKQRLFDYVIPRVFDDELVGRIRSELMEAFLDARSGDDATALMAGVLGVYSDDKGQSPLYQVLLQLTIGEAFHVNARMKEFGLTPDAALTEAVLNDPAELDRLASDPHLADRFGKALRTDPILQRRAESVARQSEDKFFNAVADGTVEAVFSEEELDPLSDRLCAFFEQLGPDTEHTPLDEDAKARYLSLLLEYADAPNTRPAFDCFTRELRGQADRMAPQGGPEALKIKVFADLWERVWRHDSSCRALLVAAFLRRFMAAARRAQDDEDDLPPDRAQAELSDGT